MPESLLQKLKQRRQLLAVKPVDVYLENVFFQVYLICLRKKRRDQQGLAVRVSCQGFICSCNDKIRFGKVIGVLAVHRQQSSQFQIIMKGTQKFLL